MSIQDQPIWKTLTREQREALLERAAIMEFDAKLTREQAEAKAIEDLKQRTKGKS